MKVENNQRFIWPVPGFNRVSSPFGMRVANGVVGNHRGIDIGRNLSPPEPIENANIVAIADGKVTASFFNETGGNMIIIYHDNQVHSRYLHNSINLVRASQNVKQGQIIGRVGNTGHSFGAHLHLDLIINGVHVNPLDYITIGSSMQPKPIQQKQLFRVQVGAFRERANAELMALRIQNEGFYPFITTGNDNLLRVQVGAFRYRQNAETLRIRLQELGFEAFVTS